MFVTFSDFCCSVQVGLIQVCVTVGSSEQVFAFLPGGCMNEWARQGSLAEHKSMGGST